MKANTLVLGFQNTFRRLDNVSGKRIYFGSVFVVFFFPQ